MLCGVVLCTGGGGAGGAGGGEKGGGGSFISLPLWSRFQTRIEVGLEAMLFHLAPYFSGKTRDASFYMSKK